MSRRHRAEKREVLPDPKFGDLILTKFMNGVMYEGKKAVAENIVYGALDILVDKRRDRHRANSSMPPGQCRPVDRSPFPPGRRRHLPGAGRVRPERRRALAIRWLITPRASAARTP